MIVTQPELDELLDSEHIFEFYGTLSVESINEFRTNLQVRETEYRRGVYKEIEKYQDHWKLQSGKPYIVEFQESVDPTEGYIPIILPSSLSMQVGLVAYPRIANDGGLWTLIVPHSGVDVYENAVLSIIVIGAFYNNPASTNDKETPEDEDNQ